MSVTFTPALPTYSPSYTVTVINDQNPSIDNVVIYPNPYNPKKGNLKISFDAKGSIKVIKVKIYSSGFRLVKQITKQSTQNVMEIESRYLSGLANGAYYVTLNGIDEKGRQTNSKPVVLVIIR